jgi:hypothetical protein
MKYISHIPRKKDYIIWFAVFVVIILIPGVTRFVLGAEDWFLILPLGILAFLMFNLLIRKSLSFKSYFTSPFNVLTAKKRSEILFTIPRELMFEKIIEVINDSNFKLINANRDKYEILATTRISWLSWGENLYISFENKENETIMKFCSATLFQIYSWGKNERNYDNLLKEIEDSLTV